MIVWRGKRKGEIFGGIVGAVVGMGTVVVVVVGVEGVGVGSVGVVAIHGVGGRSGLEEFLEDVVWV